MADSDGRAFIRLAESAEGVAAGLYSFRDSLPRNAARITAVVGELFAISSTLRGIDATQTDRRYQPSFYRIENDIGLACVSLQYTLDAVAGMFGRSRELDRQMVWDDLQHRMERVEGLGLLERLECYKDFLKALLEVVTGCQPQGLRELKREIVTLLDAQEVTRLQFQGRRQTLADATANTPQPRPARPPLHRPGTPVSRNVFFDSWDYERAPPMAPEAPSTYDSSSSPTLLSTDTSYSDDPHHQTPPPSHWASTVFNGTNPTHTFRPSYRLDDPSVCHGTVDMSSLQHLTDDGFIRILEVPFDLERLWVQLYWRPSDLRARILVTTKDSHHRDVHYCAPLTNLKIIRDRSCLQLCRARHDGKYELWARLNFVSFERMVLFYCTLAAMKRQDSHPLPHANLLDAFELVGANNNNSRNGETELYGGAIQHGDLRHALRLFQDRGSGVVRLEACALRGPMRDVPLWTAFVTRYAQDPDWAQLERRRGGVVSLAALRPPPFVFVSGYEPLRRDGEGQYLLDFETTNDARDFMEVWIGLCRAA